MINIKVSHLLVILFVCVLSIGSAQGTTQYLDLTYPGRTFPVLTKPISIYACETTPQNYFVEVDNFSPFDLANLSFTIKLPKGIIYSSNFASTGNSSSSVSSFNDSTVVIFVDTLEMDSTIKLSFDIIAGCDVFEFGVSGGTFNVLYDAVFTQISNGVIHNRSKIFEPIIVNYPKLQFTNWSFLHNSNLTYDLNTPKIGDTIDRKITVINGGSSRIDEVVFRSDLGSSLDLLSYSLGTHTSVGSAGSNSYQIKFSGTNFSTVGNGDVYLDPGDTLIFIETVILKDCNNPNTDYSLFWGCGTDICQLETDEINIIFPVSSPKLLVTPIIDTTLCKGFGSGAKMGLKLQNIGSYPIDSAVDTYVEVFQGGITFSSNMLSVLDTSTISVIEVGTGALLPFVIVSSSPSNPSTCNAAGSNSVASFKIKIDKIYYNKIVNVTWRVFSCYNLSCTNGYVSELDWGYSVNYSNRCDVEYNEHSDKVALDRYHLVHDLSPGSSPRIVTPANTSAIPFKFAINNSLFNFFKDPATDYLKYEITKPSCLKFANSNSNVYLQKPDGTKVYAGASNISVSASGNVITVLFHNNIHGLTQGELIINLKQDCGNCTPGLAESISVQSYYSIGSCATSEHLLGCATMPLTIMCTPSCPEFLVNFSFTDVKRVNYDLPDLNDDGLPDASAPMYRLDSVRHDRATYLDVIEQYLNVELVHNQSLQKLTGKNYIYYYARINNGEALTLDSLTLGFDFFNTTTYVTSYNRNIKVPFTHTTRKIAGTDSLEFLIEMDIAALRTAGIIPSASSGSISHFEFKSYYHVNKNLGLSVTPLGFDMCAFADANVFALTSGIETKKSQYCFMVPANIDLIGFSYTSHHNDYYSFASCDSVKIRESMRFNTGTYIYNNPATNYFPNEYRNFSHPDSLKVNLSGSFNITGAKLNFSRTAGTMKLSTAAFVDILPYMSGGGTSYAFSFDSLFKDPSAAGISAKPFFFSDEGYGCTVELTLQSNCASTGGVQMVNYEWILKTDSLFPRLDTCNTPPIAYGVDRLEYVAPEPLLFPSVQLVRVQGKTVTWDVLIKNKYASDAANVWFGFDNLTTLNVTNVKRISSSGANEMGPINKSVPFTTVSPFSGLYRINNLFGGKEIKFRITANIDSTHCNLDSLNFVIGYDCNGYPSSINTVTCPVTSLPLYAQPMLPNLYNEITTVSDTIGLCDTAEYVFRIENTDIGRAYDIIGNVFLQQNLVYIPGSSSMYHNSTGTWAPAIPSIGSFGQLVYDVTSVYGSLSNGLVGLVDPSNNYVLVKFKVTAECNYTSGSKIEVNSSASAACGYNFISPSVFSNALHITGATPSHRNNLTLTSGYLSPCFDSTDVNLKIVNLGPISTWTGDSITIVLPRGIHYANGSYSAISNVVTTNPSILTYGGKEYLTWKLNNLATNVDTASLNIKIYSNFDTIKNCDARYLYAYTTTQDNLICSATGTSCPVKIISGDTAEPIFNYKAITDLSNPTAYSVPNPPSGETVFVSFDIENLGQATRKTVNGNQTTTTVSYYRDVDNSKTYTALDILIASSSSSTYIPQGISTYFDTINIAAIDACNFIAVIDFDENTCVCNTSEIYIVSDSLVYNEPDDTVCSNIPQQIGYVNDITGYTYTWTAGTNANLSYLSSSVIPAPIITAPSTTTSGIDSMIYFVEINRAGCIDYDTINVYVISNIISKAGNDTTICYDSVRLNGNNAISPNPSFYSLNTYWVIDSAYGNGVGGGGVTIHNPNSHNTLITGLTSGAYQFIWVIDNGSCNPSTDTVKVFVTNPIFNAGTDTAFCTAADVTLYGDTSTPGFTSEWKILPTSPSGATLQDSSLLNSLLQNLKNGVYALELTVSNTECSFTDTVYIDITEEPTVNAGIDDSICGKSTFRLGADSISGTRTGVWTFDANSGDPSKVTIANVNSDSSSVTITSGGVYRFIWNAVHPTCDTVKDTVEITMVGVININAGNDTTLCDPIGFKLNADTLTETNQVGTWRLLTGQSGVTFSNDHSDSTEVTGMKAGTYLFEWTIDNGICDSVTDTVEIIVDSIPVVNAGMDDSICGKSTFRLGADSISGTRTGVWTFDANSGDPSKVTIANVNSDSSSVTITSGGVYRFIWNAVHPTCDTVKDTVEITMVGVIKINAGNDTTLCDPIGFKLNADTLTETNQVGTWRLLTGQSGVTFSNDHSDSTEVTGMKAGTYLFEWTIDNGICDSVTDTVEIIVDSIPVVNAGMDDSICGKSTFRLGADSISGTRTGVWTLDPSKGDPSKVTIANVNSDSSSVTITSGGVYRFIWNAVHPTCDTVKDTVEITMVGLIKINAGNDTTLCDPIGFKLNADTLTETNQVGTWRLLTSQSGVTFSNDHSDSTEVTGMKAGTYLFEWTINNGICDSVTDTVTITVDSVYKVNAGVDSSFCGVSKFNLWADSIPNGRKGVWTVDPSAGNSSNVTIAYADSNTSQVTISARGKYNLIWSDTNSICETTSDTVEITLADSISIFAGNDTTICDSLSDFRLYADSTTGLQTGTWRKISGPGIVTFSNNHSDSSIVSGMQKGIYSFEWEIDNGICNSVLDTVSVIVKGKPNAFAGNDDSLCSVDSVRLTATALNLDEVGAWRQVSGPNTATFSNSSVHNSDAVGLVTGTYLFEWRVSNEYCTDSLDFVSISIFDSAIANAGIDTGLCSSSSLNLYANSIKSGENGTWSQLTGPSSVTFADSSLPATNVSGLVAGIYNLEWKVEGFCNSVTDIITITIDNNPIANAGTDQSVCITDSVVLAATPVTGRDTGAWSQLSGPNTASIVDSSIASTAISGLMAGIYEFVWSVDNKNCPIDLDTVEIEVFAEPVISAGNDFNQCDTNSFALNANSILASETGNWSNLASNPTTATFANPAVHNSTVSGLGYGLYKFVWLVSNSGCSAVSDTISVKIDSISTTFAGMDTAICNSSTYIMSATPLSGLDVGSWTQIDANPKINITPSHSHSANLSALTPNDYRFVWTVSNPVCPSVSDTVDISIYEAPVSNAGPDQKHCDTNSVSVSSRYTHSKNYHSYSWSFDAARSSFTPVPNIVAPSDSNTVINNLAPGIYYFVLEVSNTVCDSVIDTVKIEIFAKPIVDFTVDDTSVCLNVCNNFTNLSTLSDPSGSVISNYSWSFGDGNNSTTSDPTHCYNTVGDYTVKLYVVSNNGCIDSMVKLNYISVNPLPSADFTVGPDELNPGAQTIFTDLSFGAQTYVYDFGDGNSSTNPNPIYNYAVAGTYVVEQFVTNQYGCRDSITKSIVVIDQENVFVPNAFTPDNDGTNDIFIPRFSSVDSENYNFKVFNRWGEIMFQTTDLSEGWDGTHNGVKVPTGTYVYRIAYKDLNGLKIQNKSGHVTLLK